MWEAERFCYMVTEFCTGGDLLSYVTKLPFYTESFVADIMRQIFQGVQFLHTNEVIHRDIKPHNIFVHFAPGNSVTFKVADFALAGKLDPKKKMKHRYGTFFFTAPEVFDGEFDEKCDLWSCGVLMHLLLSGRLPFSGSSPEEIEEEVHNMDVEFSDPAWQLVSEEAKDLI